MKPLRGQAVRRGCLSIHQRAVHKIEMNVVSDTKIFAYTSAAIWENKQLLEKKGQNGFGISESATSRRGISMLSVQYRPIIASGLSSIDIFTNILDGKLFP
ncbi:hypothetical protein CEXT_719671 [Caerostris extrusa]|uniref:Uncharacterized protein n=1 Tax=Caerostris extrusa TaxID=172846 RepID=A0AAV4VZD0_CAEEX|nr:hypothetical protein CEXT_719671 [Caerostris extrusa]